MKNLILLVSSLIIVTGCSNLPEKVANNKLSAQDWSMQTIGPIVQQSLIPEVNINYRQIQQMSEKIGRY